MPLMPKPGALPSNWMPEDAALIRVTDDGVGMHRDDDALMCLERHATSKIQEASDLTSIRAWAFVARPCPVSPVSVDSP